MRKVIKYSLHSFSGVLLVLIAVPLLAALLLYLPPVQNALVKTLAGWAGDKIGTTVSIERFRIGIPNKFIFEGLYVEDLQGDTLLYADRLQAGARLGDLLRGPLSLGDVSLEGVRFYMKQDADSTSNIRKIMNRLRSDKEKDKKPFSLHARSLSVVGASYRFRKLSPDPREYGVNFTDIDLVDGYLDLRNISVVGDSVAMSIGNVSLREKSGFVIDSLSVEKFSISPSGQFYENMRVNTPDSRVAMDYLRLVTGTWDAYGEFIEEVEIEGAVRDSRVSFRTIAFFAPTLRDWQTTFEGVDAVTRGTVGAMSGSVENARTGDTRVAVDYDIRGLPDAAHTRFRFNVRELRTDIADAALIASDIAGAELPAWLTSRSAAMGEIDFRGSFDGLLSNFRADGTLRSGDGSASFDMSFVPQAGAATAIAGKLSVEGFEAGHMLGSPKLGKLSMTGQLEGTLARGNFSADGDVSVSSLDYNGYRYHDIHMKGLFRDRLFKGGIDSRDPNLSFDFNGTLDFNGRTPDYDFAMALHNADLRKLNFNSRDSVSRLSARLRAVGSGLSPDELNGRVTVDSMAYVNHLETVRTGRMEVTGRNDSLSKYIAFRSGFADAEYRSRMSYKHVFSQLRVMAGIYMPDIARAGHVDSLRRGAGVSAAENFTMVKIDVKQANNVTGIFVPGLKLEEGTNLYFTFNPDVGSLQLRASSKFIEYHDNFITQLNVNARNVGDSISLYAHAADMYFGGMYMPDFTLLGGLHDNNIRAQAGIADTLRNFSALVGANATLAPDSASGRPQARIAFTPSRIRSGDKVWTLSGSGITVDSTMVDIRRLRIDGPQQSLRIRGRASRNREDTLQLDLRRFDLEPFSQFTSRMGYNLRGNASGYVNMASALGEGIMHAEIEFDSVSVNNVPLAPGLFRSRWEREGSRAGFMLAGRNSGDTILRGFFSPKEGRYMGRIDLKGLDMSLLDPLFEGVIHGTQGLADASGTVRGERKKMFFNGEIAVPEVTTTIDYLNVPYTVRDARIKVENNVLSIDGTSLRDPEGNRAQLGMSVDLNSLSNVKYRFDILPNKLLVLNTTARENKLFYGKVYADGSAVIRGDRTGVDMKITATTAGESEFYMPLTDETTMGVSDIITFINPERASQADSSDYLVRKRMIMDRRSRKADDKGRQSGNVNINMAVTVLPNAEFQLLIDPRVGDILKGRGTGSLTMNLNTANNEFTMTGDYEIEQGSYRFTLQDIISKRFTIEQGSTIMWTGDPADALLDVTAVYRLKASLSPLLGEDDRNNAGRTVPVELRIKLSDRLSQPTVTYNVELPGLDPETQALVAYELGTQESMSTQFIVLLAANTFMPKQGAGNIGAAGGSAMAYEFLANQLGNIISNEKFDVGIRYTPYSDYNSDEVTLDFSTQLFSNRLLLEMEGSYDSGNNPSANINNRSTSNITGDFYLTWLMDRAGSLRLKAFTRTIDRFDENQGLQESGVGIYYREDFNNAGDIVRNFKDRFANWGRKRRERKAAEEAAAAESPDADMGAAVDAGGEGLSSGEASANVPDTGAVADADASAGTASGAGEHGGETQAAEQGTGDEPTTGSGDGAGSEGDAAGEEVSSSPAGESGESGESAGDGTVGGGLGETSYIYGTKGPTGVESIITWK